jgi:hypothetical protein
MTQNNELAGILQNMRHAVQLQLSQYECGDCKLYVTGPGGASIDGTPQYFEALKQQLTHLDRALTISRQGS